MVKKSPKILVISSEKSELTKVSGFLSKIFQEYHLAQEYYNKVLLCISEAVINSIEHGNKNDHKKLVTIELFYFNDDIYIEVRDEGDGFNYYKVANPTDSQNIKKESGRGIHIIRSLSDSVTFNKKGNGVKLKIRCK